MTVQYQVQVTMYFTMDTTQEELLVLAKKMSDRAEAYAIKAGATGFMPIVKSSPSMITQEG